MDGKSTWQTAYVAPARAKGKATLQLAAPVSAAYSNACRGGGYRDEEQDQDKCALDNITSRLSRGYDTGELIEKTQDLHCQSDRFRRASSQPRKKPFKKMGVTFRDSSSQGTVVMGKRTVKDGEACGVWDVKGEYHVVEGPRREWLFMSRVCFLDRHVADSNQYLVIRHRSGKKEHKRGPIATFEDPVQHEGIEVMNAVTVDAFEVIIVYSEDESGTVKRSMIHGPKVFVPDVSQWLHVFKWHGSTPGGDLYNKVPGALTFTKLRTIADQFYYNCQGVRTADDAALTIKVMVFFQLENLEMMLNSTHDPIGDFINGLLADMMNFGSHHTYEAFIQQAQQLSELATYPMLVQRAASVGFRINKVVYRGYSSSEQLQSLCDKAIRTRTEMRLVHEEQEQKQRLRDMELKGSTNRGTSERDEEAARQEHRLRLEATAHKEGLRKQEEEHQEKLRQRTQEQQAALDAHREEESSRLTFLKGLRDMGVDLTQYMVACAEKSPDRVLKVSTVVGGGGSGGNMPLNIHTNV